ncbi:hypothetical protein F0562_025610 [Nyssa sinensis]|uniref:Uncharacterized protein n=1 Tax=Nyssa sinensis TaxID=561372 RepID=A0A5J5B8K4_9ASTE|nr:hypothetical protein F0562_025610 [Nyssa sinensis]
MGPTTSDAEASPSRVFPSRVHDSDPFASFVDEAKDVSLDFLADLSETVEVLELDGLALSWLRDHLVRLSHIPRHIACVGEIHQLESDQAKLYEQVTSLECRIGELKASCDAGGVELGLGEEGLRHSALLDLV